MLTGVGLRDRVSERSESGTFPEILRERVEQAGARTEHDINRRPSDARLQCDCFETHNLRRRVAEPPGHRIENPTAGCLGRLGPQALLVLPASHGDILSDFD
jgi:hypothetical protein